MKKLKSILLAAILPLALAGCASTNPQAAFSDVGKTVNERTGESVRWSRQDSTNQPVAQVIAPLLQTNLTAATAVTIALFNNRSLQAEFEEIGISQAELAQAARLKNLELFGSWRIPNQPPSIVDAEYSAAGNLLDLLTLPARKKIAARNLEQTKLQVADKVLQLAADAQAAFYTLQAQTELARRLNVILEVNAAGADFAQRLYDAGNINDLELHNQQVPALQARLDLMQAQAQARAEREQLDRLLGLAGEQINWTIADELPALPAAEPPLENLEALAVNQRLDLGALRSQSNALAAALRLKKGTRFIPGVMLGVDTERSPDGQRVTGPTLGLELPIFDQGQPAVARLTAQLAQATDQYAAREVNVCSEVREAREALLAARETVELSQKNLLPLRQKILGETLLQYDAMQKNSFDLLFAKAQEQMAEQTRIATLRDYWLARVALERAVGGRLPGGIIISPALTPEPGSPQHQP